MLNIDTNGIINKSTATLTTGGDLTANSVKTNTLNRASGATGILIGDDMLILK